MYEKFGNYCYICDICNFSYSSKYNLKMHEFKVHFDDEKPFFCRYCPNAYGNREQLRKHRKKHATFHCDTCIKRFCTERLLELHRKKCIKVKTNIYSASVSSENLISQES